MASLVTCFLDDRNALRAIGALVRFAGSPRPAMEEVGQAYERRVLENFSSESDPEGNPWPRLSAVTLMLRLGKGKRLKKKGTLSKKGKAYLQAKKMLVESGTLRTPSASTTTPTPCPTGRMLETL